MVNDGKFLQPLGKLHIAGRVTWKIVYGCKAGERFRLANLGGTWRTVGWVPHCTGSYISHFRCLLLIPNHSSWLLHNALPLITIAVALLILVLASRPCSSFQVLNILACSPSWSPDSVNNLMFCTYVELYCPPNSERVIFFLFVKF